MTMLLLAIGAIIVINASLTYIFIRELSWVHRQDRVLAKNHLIDLNDDPSIGYRRKKNSDNIL